ncbi:MAG: hypothetical protein ACKOEC_02555 [Acidimicrobiia bacterium]
MRKFAVLAVLVVSSALAVVADTATPISITSFGTAITQDFNTLVNTGTGTLADTGDK